ncbi:MAG: stage III sporulation protein AE [Oscillibacter sp.]|nr:stage III sporulation protein AE [Oscillibacter sp.]
MGRIICVLAAALCLTGAAGAAWEPGAAARELSDALPEAAGEYLDGAEYGASGFAGGVARILEGVRAKVGGVVRRRTKGAAAVLLSAILCGAVRSGCGDAEQTSLCLSMAGALSVTALTAGSLEQLIGLGWKTIGELDEFSKAILPAMAAAVAATGSVNTATFQQVTTFFLVETLLSLMDGFLMPLTYLYIGLLTASCALSGNFLEALADGLKKFIAALLTNAVLLFTVYLSVCRILAGAADGMAVRAVRTAVTNTVPVVGGILAQVSESVLAGAGMLKNSLGVFGMLAVVAACAYPFLELGAQYLLYKAVAVLASVAGMPELRRLIDGLGGAFGLVLGMTGSAALLLFVSLLSFLTAAAP